MKRPAPAGTVRADVETLSPKPRTDKQIWGIYLLLVFVSLVELYSASSREITEGNVLAPLLRHAGLLGLGALLMLALQRVHYIQFYKKARVILVLAIICAVYTMFFGDIINGARRSFSLGPVSVQSSEVLKFTTALFLARVLGDGQKVINGYHDISNRALVISLVTVVGFSAMLINQGLTNTLILVAIAMTMLLIAGLRWVKFLTIVGALAVLGGGYQLVRTAMAEAPAADRPGMMAESNEDRTKLRNDRMDNFINSDPLNDPITSENRQVQYSYIAQANGGVVGVGPGNSRETARLPLAFSDYIYAIVIEDLGLVGGLAVLALYMWLLARAGRVASRCNKSFPALLIIGMAVFIVYQALVHMAIVTGVGPVSGQPLPLISKGGSSVIITSFALGIMLSVSRHASLKTRRQEVADKIDTLGEGDINPNAAQL